MTVFKINSIPLKDVIKSLAESFETDYDNSCDEYFLNLPKHIGTGEIRGINFENGLGLAYYNVTFNDDMRLEFILDEIHPVKFIYAVGGSLSHEFEDEQTPRPIEEFSCAIVAAKRKNGHIINFEKGTEYRILSIEIDRLAFDRTVYCELRSWHTKLQSILMDPEGRERFYHSASSGVFFKDVFEDSTRYRKFPLARRLHLQSIAMQMFVNQVVQYSDDALETDRRTVLRIPELKKVAELGPRIKADIAGDHSIKNLTAITGLNPAKLQSGFKYLFSASVNEYVNSARLEHAYILLQNREYSIGDIVLAVGLESNSYFTRIFKNKYGMTPTEFRNSF